MQEWMYRSMVFLLWHWLEVSGQCPSRFAPVETVPPPGTQCIGEWVGPKTGLDGIEE
jgi:hypothetical protein